MSTPTRRAALHGEHPPALSRRARIERLPVVERSPAELAYLEAYDLATAYPGHLGAILEGLSDALRAGRAAP